jgi:hypothetical protein
MCIKFHLYIFITCFLVSRTYLSVYRYLILWYRCNAHRQACIYACFHCPKISGKFGQVRAPCMHACMHAHAMRIGKHAYMHAFIARKFRASSGKFGHRACMHACMRMQCASASIHACMHVYVLHIWSTVDVTYTR